MKISIPSTEIDSLKKEKIPSGTNNKHNSTWWNPIEMIEFHKPSLRKIPFLVRKAY